MTGAVKLVDAAGTLRLDLNGRRVHFNREQALELFVELGSALDDGDNFAVTCEHDVRDEMRAGVDELGRCVEASIRDSGHVSVINLSPANAVKAAVVLVSAAREVEE